MYNRNVYLMLRIVFALLMHRVLSPCLYRYNTEHNISNSLITCEIRVYLHVYGLYECVLCVARRYIALI